MSLYTFSLNTNHSHLIVTTPTDVYALPYLGLSFGTPQGPSGDEQVTFFSNGLAMVAVRIMQSNLVGATWQLRIADLIANYLYMPVGSSAGSVTSVDVSGGTTGMTFTGGPITTAGVITMGGGPLNAAHGGTDNTSYTVGDILVATGATTLSKLAAGAAGTVLSGNGAGVAPTWQTNGAGSVTSVDVSGGTSGLTYTGGPVTSAGTITLTGGSLVEGYGGTHQTTYAKGDILYASAANTLSKLAAGSNTQVLTLAAGVPSWAAPATSGTVTSVDVSGGTTGLTFSGGPVTGSGTITEAGTLNEKHGGTNQTEYTTGDILYASAANKLSKLAAGTSGYVLTMGASVPAWSPASGGGGGTVLMQRNTAGNTVSSAPNTILSLTVPANALASNGDQIQLTFLVTTTATSGTFSGTGNIQWAGSTITLSSNAFTFGSTTGDKITCTVYITRLSSSTAEVYVVNVRDGNTPRIPTGTLTGADFTVSNTLSTYLTSITGGTGNVVQAVLSSNVFKQ